MTSADASAIQKGTKVLIVDDDPMVRQLVGTLLERDGFTVVPASGAEAAREKLRDPAITVAVIDLGLEDGDGLDLVRHAREAYGIGIIILSAKGSPVEKVVGIEVGADDYIAKPFEPLEVGARVRRLISRLGVRRCPARSVRIGSHTFSTQSKTLRRVDDITISLTAAEVRLLECLVSHRGSVVSREEIMEQVTGRPWTPYDRSVDVMIGRLRTKLGGDGWLIKTVRGLGYMLVDPDADAS